MKEVRKISRTRHLPLVAVLLLIMVPPWLLILGSTSIAVPLAAGSIAIHQPDGISDVIAEGDDFATTILGLPWDMDSSPYPDFPTVMHGFGRGSFTISGGVWNGTTTTNDPGVFIHPTGLAQPVMKDGSRFPIDTSEYRLLSFRVYSSHSGYAQVFWFYDSTYTKFAGSNFIQVSSGWHTYVVDLATIGINTSHGGATGWNGSVKGLRIDPVSSGSGVNIRFDWIRLTPLGTSYTYQITWSASGASNVVLYLDNDSSGCDGTRISNNRSASSGSFNWGASVEYEEPSRPYAMPSSFEPGAYFVYAILDGEPGTCTYSPGSLMINQAPIVEFAKPSRITGQDYATVVAGNPWDMNGPPDVASTGHLSWSQYSGGVFHGTSDSSGDPGLTLNVTSLIPSSSSLHSNPYKCLTFRMSLDGTQDIGAGWVARAFWWGPSGPGGAGCTLDIVVYEGVQTYTLDLSQALLAYGPTWTSNDWTTFRIDPHEVSAPVTFHLDDVLLTRNDVSGDLFVVSWTLDNNEESDTVTTKLYYDTDTDWDNGKTFIVQLPSGAFPPLVGPHSVYVPFATKNYTGSTAHQYSWNTGGVPPGTYYIWIQVADGHSTTRWVSESPVMITH